MIACTHIAVNNLASSQTQFKAKLEAHCKKDAIGFVKEHKGDSPLKFVMIKGAGSV